MEWTTACIDWEDRLVQGKSIIPPPIFADRADEALRTFRQLRIVDAPGSPTFGESCDQWVFDYVAAIFGSYDAETGRRLIRESLLLIPKKNSKSTIAAGIMLTALILSWRVSDELIILAPTKEIALNAFKPVQDMIKFDPRLDALFQVQDHIKTVTHKTKGSTLKVVAADSDTVGGKKASWVLVDEEWLFGKNSRADSMFREAKGGLTSRPEGIFIKLSTQSDEPPAGVFLGDLQYARDVRDGVVVDPVYLPVLYEFPRAMIEAKDYLKPENFRIVNPNLGYSVDNAYLVRELRQAQEKGEQSLRDFLAKHLNVEIGMNLRSDRWAGADFWAQNADEAVSLEFILANCEVVTVGIDGGGLDDLLGLTVLGRLPNGEWKSWSHAWAHPSVLERRKEVAPRLQDFAKDKDLTMVKQIGDDLDDVVQICEQVYESGLLDKIGIDPGGIGSILDSLQDTGIPHDQIVGVAQTWRLSAAIKTVERKLAGGVFGFAESPMMNWCVGNAKIEIKGSNVYITKQAAGTAKIDPLMSLFNAAYLMAENPEARGGLDDWLSDPIRTGKA